jgi:hypothetical protein
MAAASRRAGQPTTPGLEPVFVALNPGALPSQAGGRAVPVGRRKEQYATLGANVVVELYSETTPVSQPPRQGGRRGAAQRQ